MKLYIAIEKMPQKPPDGEGNTGICHLVTRAYHNKNRLKKAIYGMDNLYHVVEIEVEEKVKE